MVKPILVTLPFLLLLIDYWPLDRFGFFEKRNSITRNEKIKAIGEKIPLLLMCLFAIGASLARHGETISVDQISLPLRLANAVVAYLRYLSNLFYPVNLTAFYPFPNTIPLWQSLGAFLVLMGISIITLFYAKKMPYLFVGWFWFTGTMFPKIGLVQAGLWPALADRWAYFPAIGIFIMVTWLCFDLLVKRHGLSSRRVGAAFFIFCTILAALTWKQVQYWSNSTRLFEHMIEKTQDNYMAHNNLGTVLMSQGKLDAAEEHFEKAIEINPDFEIPYLNIGKLAYKKGNVEKARLYYNKAIVIRPNNYGAYLALGNLQFREGEYQDAWRFYSEAIRINPDSAFPYNGMGGVLTKIGRLEEAVAMFVKALEIDPGYEPAKQNLEHVREALRSFKKQ
jgi:tetratricopeptide (TPR) repeat protein